MHCSARREWIKRDRSFGARRGLRPRRSDERRSPLSARAGCIDSMHAKSRGFVVLLPGVSYYSKRNRLNPWLCAMRALLSACIVTAVLGCNRAPTSNVDRSAPPIIRAAGVGDLDTVKRIVAHDPSAMYETDSYGNTAATWAILDDHPEVAICLIELGYPVNPRNETDFPLVMACLSRFTEGSRSMLKYLLDHGADPNVSYQNLTALNLATSSGQEQRVKLLVDYGAKLDARDGRGQTSLEIAEERLDQFKDPTFDLPHNELQDPKVRQAAIDEWERMVRLLIELDQGK